MISRNGIEFVGLQLNLFRTARTCVCFQERTTSGTAITHSAAHWRVNGGTVERYRTEERPAMPSFDTPARRSATIKAHSLQLRGPV